MQRHLPLSPRALLLVALVGCDPVASLPVAVSGKEEVAALAAEIWPGCRPRGNFIAGAGTRGPFRLASMPNFRSFGEEGRVTAFVMAFPKNRGDDKDIREWVQEVLHKFYKTPKWDVARRSPVTLKVGDTREQFDQFHITNDVVYDGVTQYLLVKDFGTHDAVLVVQGMPNLMDKHASDVRSFLGAIRAP